MSGCEVVWAIRDSSIGSTFFDEGAATFFLPHLSTPHYSSAAECGSSMEERSTVRTRPMKRMKYMLDPLDEGETKMDSIAAPGSATDQQPEMATCQQQMGSGDRKIVSAKSCPCPSSVGSALGPDWSSDLAFRGSSEHWVSEPSDCKHGKRVLVLTSVCASVPQYHRNVHVEYSCEVVSCLDKEQAEAAGYQPGPFPGGSQLLDSDGKPISQQSLLTSG